MKSGVRNRVSGIGDDKNPKPVFDPEAQTRRETRNPSPDTQNPKPDLSANDFAGAGIQFAVALVVCVLAGNWLDARLGTSPVFVLIGVFLGGGASFYSFYGKISSAQRKDDAIRRKRAGRE